MKFLSPVDLAICIDSLKKNTKWNNTLKTYFITNMDDLWVDSESLTFFPVETGQMMNKPRTREYS